MITRYVNTKMPDKKRYSIAVVLYALTALSILLFQSFYVSVIIALLLLGYASYLLISSNFTNKPKDIGREDWQMVTMTEIARVQFQIKKMKNAPVPFAYTIGFAVFLTVFFIAAAVLFFFLLKSTQLVISIISLYVIFFPFLWSARVDRWYPSSLASKLAEFDQILQFPYPKTITIVPYLRFDQTEDGDKLPEDCKFTLSFTPENGSPVPDLIGIQVQLSHNTGPNGTVPYFYTVVITKGKDRSWRILSKFNAEGFVCESGGDEEYGTLVIRQDTKIRSDAYHTKPGDVDRLLETSISAVKTLL
jgi:hypothetical protein